VISVPLDKVSHNRNRFDCGVNALNNYLKVMANQQSARDNSRTYLLEDINQPSYIVGFYTLTVTPVDLSALPEKFLKRHQNARAGGLIARLAVDKRYSGKGYGEWLLIDALNKLLSASEAVGFPVIIVDARDGAAQFYEKFGFAAFEDSPNKLFITVATVRKNLK
jgi:GNAT superfamily N-acetyltransferase